MRGPEVGAWARQNQRHCHVRRPRQVHAAVQVRPQPCRAQARSIWGAVQKAAKRASRSDSTTCRGRCSFRISDRRRHRHRRRRRRRHRCHRCSRSPSPLRSRRLFPLCSFSIPTITATAATATTAAAPTTAAPVRSRPTKLAILSIMQLSPRPQLPLHSPQLHSPSQLYSLSPAL